MDLTKLSDNELVRLVVKNPQNEAAWAEFYRRYHLYICKVVAREYNRLGLFTTALQREDLVQEVYKQLLDRRCRKLQAFKGKYDRSFFSYLEIIALRTTKNVHREECAKKRPPQRRRNSLDLPVGNLENGKAVHFEEIIAFAAWKDKKEINDMALEIEDCLNRIVRDRRHSDRDRWIFSLYYFHDLKVDEIAAMRRVKLSTQRIYSALDEMRQDMRRCLAG